MDFVVQFNHIFSPLHCRGLPYDVDFSSILRISPLLSLYSCYTKPLTKSGVYDYFVLKNLK